MKGHFLRMALAAANKKPHVKQRGVFFFLGSAGQLQFDLPTLRKTLPSKRTGSEADKDVVALRQQEAPETRMTRALWSMSGSTAHRLHRLEVRRRQARRTTTRHAGHEIRIWLERR